MYLVDLPGYGYAKVPGGDARGPGKRLVTSYLLGREPLALCVFLVDARHEPTEGDQTLRTWLDHYRLALRRRRHEGGQARPGRASARREAGARARGLGRSARGPSIAVSARTGLGHRRAVERRSGPRPRRPDARN